MGPSSAKGVLSLMWDAVPPPLRKCYVYIRWLYASPGASAATASQMELTSPEKGASLASRRRCMASKSLCNASHSATCTVPASQASSKRRRKA